MSFRGAVKRALAAPVGASLAQRFFAPTMTVLVGDARLASHDEVALAEVADALHRVGLPRGRMLTLLAGTMPLDAHRRERARELHDVLGMPVVLHDPDAPGGFTVGTTPSGFVVELDDELREAEAVVLVGEFAVDHAFGAHGGPFALLPGLATPASRARLEQQAGVQGHALRRELAREVLGLVKVDLALVWNESDPPEVRSGGGELLQTLLAEGWGDPHP
jgi:hypothetical protein